MKIGIIGAGSIGLLFACCLGERHDIYLYCRTEEQAAKIGKEGILLREGEREIRCRVRRSAAGYAGEDLDCLIVAVKSYHLPALAGELKKIPGRIPLLFLQNGMGHLPFLEGLPHRTLILGSVEHGAMRTEANRLHLKGRGVTRVALFRGDREFFARLAKGLEVPGFPFLVEDDAEEMLVRKLRVNLIINPLTALLQIPNGKLAENPDFYQAARKLFDEVFAIFPADGREETFRHVMQVCRNTAGNRSSMWKDLAEGRRTEAEAILGYALEKGKERGIRAPILETLYLLIKGLEREKVE
ncbi:MAG: 2-dehydropantoate 2-reductase [Caldibacillus debilis]|jgi:2-dehydropantoate 2-reductase|nr:2-dehydropantoate 2-reductase [Caldibacillus debilis]MBO2480524.1 2-dehydropantoate 2-reductase [Bacillaceae bacterium]MBY6272370.1 2-dehydropantoate 2-reductase [Bacillaceae bacterium]OUM89469.1 MAG: hypothetical protein BAA03_15755 [Caldibacillus debilis]REJ20151.1 MAG: 2-dehydropantoate 2-reductase [Caldibacillus debilis]